MFFLFSKEHFHTVKYLSCLIMYLRKMDVRVGVGAVEHLKLFLRERLSGF